MTALAAVLPRNQVLHHQMTTLIIEGTIVAKQDQGAHQLTPRQQNQHLQIAAKPAMAAVQRPRLNRRHRKSKCATSATSRIRNIAFGFIIN